MSVFSLDQPYIPHLVAPDALPSSDGGTGAQLGGDVPPTDAPTITVAADESIFYWDRVAKSLWVWESDSEAWFQATG